MTCGRSGSLWPSRGAPADYDVPRGLERLQLTGGGRLTWRSNPVAMVCFDRGDKQMLFLFVMKRSAVKDPPPGNAPSLRGQPNADGQLDTRGQHLRPGRAGRSRFR